MRKKFRDVSGLAKKRVCLSCDGLFWSHGPEHRVCGECRTDWERRRRDVVPSHKTRTGEDSSRRVN